jgi:hypothetical protein
MDPLRKILAENIERHRVASKLAREAASTAAKAVEFVKQTERAIAEFDGINQKVATERATAIKAAIAAGKKPDFSLSPELAGALSKRVEAENQLVAARQAAASLATEAADAQADERRAMGDVQSIANAIVTEEIDDIARAVQSAEAAATAALIKLHAADQIAKYLPGGGAKFSKLATNVMFAPSSKELMAGGLHGKAISTDAAASNWKEYACALCNDASAVLPEAA